MSEIKETEKSCHLLINYFIDEEFYIPAVVECYLTSLIYFWLNLFNILDQVNYLPKIDSLSKVVNDVLNLKSKHAHQNFNEKLRCSLIFNSL